MKNSPKQPKQPEPKRHQLEPRDLFAGYALMGWLASTPANSEHPVVANYMNGLARLSYQMADAMLEAREQ